MANLVKQTRKLPIPNNSENEIKSLPSSTGWSFETEESGSDTGSQIGIKRLLTREQLEEIKRREEENKKSVSTESGYSAPPISWSNNQSQKSNQKNNQISNQNSNSSQYTTTNASESDVGFTRKNRQIISKTKNSKKVVPKRTNLMKTNYNSNTEWENESGSSRSESNSASVTSNNSQSSTIGQLFNTKRQNSVSPSVSEATPSIISETSESTPGSVASSAFLQNSSSTNSSKSLSNNSSILHPYGPVSTIPSSTNLNSQQNRNNTNAKKPLLNNVSQTSVSTKSSNMPPTYIRGIQAQNINQSMISNTQSLLEDYKTNIIYNEKVQNIALLTIVLFNLIDTQINYLTGGKLNTDNIPEFRNQVKEVFVEMAKKPLKFEKFLVSMEHHQHQNSELYYNYNLGVRKSIGYNDYVNYYNANSSQIIERKVITILVNLIGEYTDCFIDLDDKKEIVKSIRQGIARFLYRFLEFEYAFDAIHSDCSFASSIEHCQSSIGCVHYSGPKRTGCRKVSKILSTYINLEIPDDVKKLSESDCIEFHKTITNIAHLLPDEIQRISLTYQNKNAIKNDNTSRQLMGAYNQYLNRLQNVNDKLHNISGVITRNVVGGSSSSSNVKSITNDELLQLFK